MSNKPIIVFEGIEGSGKTLHINNVANYLKKKNQKFLRIREPGGTSNSEKIRKIILNNKSTFNKITDLLLYLSARSENIALIKKNMKNKIILIDRFSDSTMAYQHYGMGINKNFIEIVNNFLCKDIKVKFTFLNIVNQKNMILRLKQRKNLNRYDKFHSSFYKRVQSGFIKILKKNPKKYMLINSNSDISKNKNIILKQIDKLI